MSNVAIIDYNLGNLFSVKNALSSIGLESVITNTREEILKADCVILPGVGSFKEAMSNIKSLQIDSHINEYLKLNKPFIGICLGLQLLFSSSEEFGDTKGLNLVKGMVKKLPSMNKGNLIRIPNIGWLPIKMVKENISEFENLIQDPFYYFVHSYYVDPLEDVTVAWTEVNGFRFTSAIKKGNIFATQFHPEKSGELGLDLLKNIKSIISRGKHEQN